MFHALVVGAGPAGSAAALYMQRAGLSVLLVDRAGFPRDKVCGDAISRKATAMLPDLGIDSLEAVDDCLPSYGVRLYGEDGAALSLSFHEEFEQRRPPGYVCTRRSFDQLLVERSVAEGVTFWPHARMTELIQEGDSTVGARITRLQGVPGQDPIEHFPRTEEVMAPLVVGADGAYSVVARELRVPQLNERHHCAGIRGYVQGVQSDDPMNHLEVHFLEAAMPGYFWVSPLPDGRANVGVGMLSRTIKERGTQLKDVLWEAMQRPGLRERFARAELDVVTKEWGLPLGSRPRRMAGNGWMLVGDAASLIDPFAGEGIGNAILSGRIAARVAARAAEEGRFSAEELRAYPRQLMSELRGEFRRSRALQRLGRWEWLLNTVIRKGSRSEDVSRMMTGMLDDERSRRKLFSPLFYLRVLLS